MPSTQSCGYTVPYYDFRADRTALLEYMSRCEKADVAFEPDLSNTNAQDSRAEKGMRNYWVKYNSTSIDGLPGVQIAPYAEETPHSGWVPEKAKARNNAGNNGVVASKEPTNAGPDAKLVGAFSLALGVLVTAVFMKLFGSA